MLVQSPRSSLGPSPADCRRPGGAASGAQVQRRHDGSVHACTTSLGARRRDPGGSPAMSAVANDSERRRLGCDLLRPTSRAPRSAAKRPPATTRHRRRRRVWRAGRRHAAAIDGDSRVATTFRDGPSVATLPALTRGGGGDRVVELAPAGALRLLSTLSGTARGRANAGTLHLSDGRPRACRRSWRPLQDHGCDRANNPRWAACLMSSPFAH